MWMGSSMGSVPTHKHPGFQPKLVAILPWMARHGEAGSRKPNRTVARRGMSWLARLLSNWGLDVVERIN